MVEEVDGRAYVVGNDPNERPHGRRWLVSQFDQPVALPEGHHWSVTEVGDYSVGGSQLGRLLASDLLPASMIACPGTDVLTTVDSTQGR